MPKAEYAFSKTHKHMREHRAVVETNTGKKLGYNDVVHHKNKNKLDNSVDNLVVLSRSDHSRLHAIEQWNTNRQTMLAIAQNNMRKINIARRRLCTCFSDNGVIVKTYESADDMISDGLNPICVYRCCLGKRKTYKKLLWKYTGR